MRKKFRILTVAAIAAAMLLPTCFVFAQDEVVQTESELIPEGTGLPDNDELFAGYVDKMFYGGESAVLSGEAAREQLSDQGKKLYDFLKVKIESVARGELSSTVFSLDEEILKELGAKVTWNSNELKLDTTDALGDVMTLFWDQFETVKVIDALLHDCPYDFYWYDKVDGMSRSCGVRITSTGASYREASIVNPGILFRVVQSYQADGYDRCNPAADTARTGAATVAADVAHEIVARNAELDDYEKLKAYRDAVCNLTSYNHDVSNISYGDPWQVIYVFDDDDTTNAVCEGYAKAFQYLCDISDFNDDIACYTVTGVMSGAAGAGGHMWNNVTMEDGKNYLVDLTNSDTGTVGSKGELFLAGASGTIDTYYTVTANYGINRIIYMYDDDAKMMWGTGENSILNLAESKYVPSETEWEYLEVSTKLSDTLIVKKVTDESGAEILSISARGNKELPELRLCTAVYEPDGALRSVVSTPYEGENMKLIVPEVGEGEEYKLMLWAEDQTPVIEIIKK